MNITYTDKAKESSDFSLLQQANEQLKEVLGPSAGLVSAAWDRTQDDKGRPWYSLRISDFTGKAEATFAPDELPRPTHLRVRLYRLWGDLLQARSRQQLEELKKS